MPMDAAKTWQGAPPTAFKSKKAFIPRLVRSNKPDHVIGASAVLQVSRSGRMQGDDCSERFVVLLFHLPAGSKQENVGSG